MKRAFWLIPVLVLAGDGGRITLKVRSRVEAFKGSGQWQAVELGYPLPLDATAAVICDMWDKHWCRGANERVGGLVTKMEPFLERLRASGVLIIHAPSETMEFYKESAPRRAVLGFSKVAPPEPLGLTDPPLPVDASDGGCDTPGDSSYKAWKRQHAGLTIGPNDLISDNGQEIYNVLSLRGIKHLLVMGVHTNMCILNRTFAIRQMTKWGIRCILVRDLTDAMYDPKDKPYVSHEAGTGLVVEHIEKYWAPSTLSVDVLRALR
ncbi:MAG: isochorismatase family protein [Acidobacteria bacterium]|nr:isochorismatase family protein [Acidobacteriota bacterium]